MRETAFAPYKRVSDDYDATRIPVGLDIILGALRGGSRPLSEMRLLDAGCGTGN